MTPTGMTVGLLALGTALATGLGALPFAFARRISRRQLGLTNALAAGLMVAASLGLLYEGGGRGGRSRCSARSSAPRSLPCRRGCWAATTSSRGAR